MIKLITKMRITHSLTLASLLLCGGMQIAAQDCSELFPQKEGAILKYTHYDKKDKVTGGHEVTLKEKQETAGGLAALLATKYFDDKGEKIYDSEIKLECSDGVIYFDASSMLDPATMSAYQSMDVEITGDNLEIPMSGSAGTDLKDGGVTAVVSSGGMKIMTISINLTNRKIAANESIQTPAGSFDCVKYTYDVVTKAGFVSVSTSGVEWYSRRYGSVRSESYNKSGKLVGYTVLESVE